MKPVVIILCELQCYGFEHSPFNAALLDTVRLAYPSAKILYYGEETHLNFVRIELEKIQIADDFDFRSISIPNPKITGWRRVPIEFSIAKKMLNMVSQVDAKALIFCSITNTSLLLLKLLMYKKHLNIPTTAIVHSCLSSIAGQQARRPWNWIIGFKQVLVLPQPRNLQLVALSDSILRNVKKILPKTKSQWRFIDHVYLWPSIDSDIDNQLNKANQPICFGYLGVSNKGFDVFCQLAEEVKPLPEIAQFIMVGFYNGIANKKPVCSFIHNIPSLPLPREEFERGMNKLSYVVWTAKPDDYRLVASGTFLDALAFLKPGIYLRNNYIEYYFDQLGDIGYLCDSYADMVETIKEIIFDFPSIRYQCQIKNIMKGREIFQPENQSSRLRQIIEGS